MAGLLSKRSELRAGAGAAHWECSPVELPPVACLPGSAWVGSQGQELQPGFRHLHCGSPPGLRAVLASVLASLSLPSAQQKACAQTVPMGVADPGFLCHARQCLELSAQSRGSSWKQRSVQEAAFAGGHPCGPPAPRLGSVGWWSGAGSTSHPAEITALHV